MCTDLSQLFLGLPAFFLKRLNVNFSPYCAERVREVGIKKEMLKTKKNVLFQAKKKVFCDPKFFMFQALALSLSMEHYFPLKDSMRHLLNNVLTIKKSYLTKTVRAAQSNHCVLDEI
jgi:hypothetical protein